MILTLTPNPSIDATLSLDEPLTTGLVHRARSVSQVAGGKGINVTHAAYLAGHPTVALFPAGASDLFLSLVEEASLPYEAVPLDQTIRVNTTITDPAGDTAKINGPGPLVGPEVQQEIIQRLGALSANADWVVLAGSLPPGCPTDWYSSLIKALRSASPQTRIAVDTSDQPMLEIARNLEAAAPDLLKPNGFELGQLAGEDGLALEEQAAGGDYSGVVAAARSVVQRGVAEILVTLGGAGAVLVTADGAWVATPPAAEVVSTVGAGDSALAGYLLARTDETSRPESLRQAVAYGTAAAGLAGTALPRPDQIDLAGTTLDELDN